MSVTCGFAYLDHAGKNITAGQGLVRVSEDRLHQKAHACWPLSSRLTVMPGDGDRPGYQVIDRGGGGWGGVGRGSRVLRARLRFGAGAREAGWTARLVPLTVDGLIYAGSM